MPELNLPGWKYDLNVNGSDGGKKGKEAMLGDEAKGCNFSIVYNFKTFIDLFTYKSTYYIIHYKI